MMQVGSKVKSASICAVKVLPDGTRVDLGTVAYFHRNALMRMWFSIKKIFRRVF